VKGHAYPAFRAASQTGTEGFIKQTGHYQDRFLAQTQHLTKTIAQVLDLTLSL